MHRLEAPSRAAMCRRGAPRARGFSLVELLVAASIGLMISAAGVSFLTTSVRENRGLLLESRLMQDLRTATDVVTRDLRRAGYWGAAEDGAWGPGASAAGSNPYAALVLSGPSAGASVTSAGASVMSAGASVIGADASTTGAESVSFQFSRDLAENGRVDGNEEFGFRLRQGTLEMLLGAENWQALTDSGTVTITAFSVTPTVQEISLAAACSSACAASSTTCPPKLSVRILAVQITGQAVADAHITRSLRSSVRLRNDRVVGACPT